MPETSSFASFVSLHYNLKFTPHETPEPEQLYQRALMALNHVGALGHVVCFLSSAKLCDDHRETVSGIQDRAEELDKGLYVLGQLIAAIADEGYAAVVELNDILTEPKSDSPPVEEASVKKTVAHRQDRKTGKIVKSTQLRESTSGRYHRNPTAVA